MSTGRTIWQYWETRGVKPAFVDGLHELARRNAGVPVVQVTPETLPQHLPDLSEDVHAIQEMAHKADMIRTRLIARHGGMWLDSDAIVIRDLNWIFDFLDRYDFVGFNDSGRLTEERPWVRVNCFAAPAGSQVMARWVELQTEKLPKGKFDWEEIGTQLIHPICLEHSDRVQILPFERICPVRWNEVARFGSRWRTPRAIIDDVTMVMLSNKSLEERFPDLQRMSIDDIREADIYLSHFLRRAEDPNYMPPSQWRSLLAYCFGQSAGRRTRVQAVSR